ncbi:Bromodomain protein [Trichuris suis]|nr:Bromodomain protein [Trichuris suis]
MAVNSLKEEIQGYWELPAIAHFCSLFRVVFKFSEFDIESLEEAFVFDEEGLGTDTRSSLILDTLICLLRGITGRREVSLHNYNRYFYRLMTNYWEALGFGPNPFGPDITKANYHRLPLYARVKLMYALCELRLTRNDVEHALREFSGDSMRVIHLGEDRNGVTYWYFYGTRLYAEDPEIKITIPLRHGDKKKRKSEVVESDNDGVQVGTYCKSSKARRRKRKGRTYDFGLSRKKRKCSRKVSTSRIQSLADQNDASKLPSLEESEEAVPTETVIAASSVPQEESTREEDEQHGNLGLPRNETASSLGRLASEIYSGNELSSDEERESFKEEQSEFKSSGIGSPASSCNPSWSATDAEVTHNSTELKVDESTSHIESETKSFASNVSDSMNETRDSSAGASELCPSGVVESQPWLDQPFLKPPARRRWRVRCDTLDDWKNLVDSLKGSTVTKERRLYDLLQNSFLPEIEKFYEQKKVEKQQRESEMVRRLSERLETRRSLRERAPPPIFHDFFYSGDEDDHDSLMSEDRRRQLDIERREQRYRMRALEKEKQEKLKERAREERARRMEMRKRRQAGDFLASNDDTVLNDRSLNELDIQLELEFMYGQLEKLLYALKETSDAWPFVEPVTEEIAPNYFQFIKKPMDLETIEAKLMNREYKNKLEFIEDINLMLLNCLEYNGLRNDYTKTAQRLERSFIRLWKRYFPPSQSSDEDSGLNCVALLGALDTKIKEKIKEELNLMRQNAVPSSSSQYTTERAFFREKVVQSLVRTVPLPQRSSMSGRSSASFGKSFRPIAPRVNVASEGTSLAVSQAKSVQPKVPAADHQQAERRAALMAGCFYLFNASDGSRLVRLVGPDGGQPLENAARQADDPTPLELYRPGYKVFNVSETITVAFCTTEQHRLNPPRAKPNDAFSANATSPNIASNAKGLFVVQSLDGSGQQQSLVPSVGSSSPQPVVLPNVGGIQRVSTKPGFSVLIVHFVTAVILVSASSGRVSRSEFLNVRFLDVNYALTERVVIFSLDQRPCVFPKARKFLNFVSTLDLSFFVILKTSGSSSFDNVPASASPKTSSGALQSSPASTNASIAVCDQAIVVLAANQVFVGDTGCYIVSSSPGSVVTSQTPTATTSAIGSSASNNRGVQIIQVVPQVVVASSSETGLAPSAVTYNTGSTPNTGQPH